MITFNSIKMPDIKIECKPELIWEQYISFVKGEKVVGAIDVTFDFNKMPEEYHGLALMLIQRNMSRVAMPI